MERHELISETISKLDKRLGTAGEYLERYEKRVMGLFEEAIKMVDLDEEEGDLLSMLIDVFTEVFDVHQTVLVCREINRYLYSLHNHCENKEYEKGALTDMDVKMLLADAIGMQNKEID